MPSNPLAQADAASAGFITPLPDARGEEPPARPNARLLSVLSLGHMIGGNAGFALGPPILT